MEQLDPRLRENGEDDNSTSALKVDTRDFANPSPQSQHPIHHQQQLHQHHTPQNPQHHILSPRNPYAPAATTNPPGPTAPIAVQTPDTPVSPTTGNFNTNPRPYHPNPASPDDDQSDHSSGTPGPNDNHEPAKKARACEHCRRLKVKCEPDPDHPNAEGPCRRCVKGKRDCVVTAPSRKRQKKTDNRVAELERQLAAIEHRLFNDPNAGPPMAQPTKTAGVVGDGSGPPVGHRLPSLVNRQGSWSGTGGMDRERDRMLQPSPNANPSPIRQQTHSPTQNPTPMMLHHMLHPPPMVMAGQKKKFTPTWDSAAEDVRDVVAATSSPQPQPLSGPGANEYSDMVDRGIITMEQAIQFFRRYTDIMAPHLPGVVFPAGTTAAEVRKQKPVLFLSLMAASSSDVPSVQKILVKELMQVIADKVIIIGEKSIELIQAILVAVMWYWPPEYFEELKFYQLVHIAAVMAIDIGLGRKKSFGGGLRRHIPQRWREQYFRTNSLPDPTTIESRRTWMTCFFLATNTSMAMHRPNLIRWNTFLQECIDILETSPDAAPTDQYLCHLVWTHKLAEEVGYQFEMDDPDSRIDLTEPRTKFKLRGFERELEKYTNALPESMKQPSLMLNLNTLNLYMHEIATQTEHIDDLSKPPTTNGAREPTPVVDMSLTPAHVSALSSCLTAIDGIFEVFFTMDVESIRCLPVFNFVRVAYAVVVLIKIWHTASNPKSDLGTVIDKNNMNVDRDLARLIQVFEATAAEEKSRPAGKFLAVLLHVRGWLQRQGLQGTAQQPKDPQTNGLPGCMGNLPNPNPGPPNQAQQQPQPQQGDYSNTASTPLQLLAGIAATANDVAAGQQQQQPPRDGNRMYNWANNANMNQPQPAQGYYDNNTATPSTSNTVGLTPGSDDAAGPSNMNPDPVDMASGMYFLDGSVWMSNLDYGSLGMFGDGAISQATGLMGLADGVTGLGLGYGMPPYGQGQQPRSQPQPQNGYGQGLPEPQPQPPQNGYTPLAGMDTDGTGVGAGRVVGNARGDARNGGYTN